MLASHRLASSTIAELLNEGDVIALDFPKSMVKVHGIALGVGSVGASRASRLRVGVGVMARALGGADGVFRSSRGVAGLTRLHGAGAAARLALAAAPRLQSLTTPQHVTMRYKYP